jgi:pimeloyl-ACP methyl ester carboxylesterase
MDDFMRQESYFCKGNECHFMAHSELNSTRPTILFIHGLGDSSVSYYPYLNSSLINFYNILIPDLLGYGKSSCSRDYSFQHQVTGVVQHIEYLQNTHPVQFDNIILIAHSMGSIHATLLCQSHLNIKAFMNVEGSITQYGSFVAEKMTDAIKKNKFKLWYQEFKNSIYQLAQGSTFMRTYYAGLEFCDLDAFLKNGMQMYQMSHALSGQYTHVSGKEYIALTIPKIYCYGDSMCKETIMFLRENHLDSCYFQCNSHFLLTECFDEFVSFIDRYCSQYK